MFSKKYVFETNSTKHQRLLAKIILLAVALVISCILLCIYIPIYAQAENDKSKQTFYQKAPDLIAVFTGDSGRIAYALEKAKEYPSSKIFISGVHIKNSLKTIIQKQSKGMSVKDFLDMQGHQVELDYLARNTVENALSTRKYLQANPEMKNVLIISSDYHLLRIQLIINTIISDPKIHFSYTGITNDYKKMRSLKLLLKEVYKLVKNSIFLLFYDVD